MPLATHDGKTIFFAHVPKTGGSTVEDYLLQRCEEVSMHAQSELAGGGSRTGIIIPVPHLAATDLQRLLPASVDYCFAVVRDPMQRLQSEYRFQSGVSIASRLSFSNWLRIVIRAAEREPRLYENHIRPQYELIPDGAEIFRLEDGLEKVADRLNEVLGTTAPDLSMGHVLRRKSQKFAWSREDALLVAEFYAEDYRRYGYPAPDADRPSDRFAKLRDLAAIAPARALIARQRRTWLT